jgi:hypothetical protein
VGLTTTAQVVVTPSLYPNLEENGTLKNSARQHFCKHAINSRQMSFLNAGIYASTGGKKRCHGIEKINRKGGEYGRPLGSDDKFRVSPAIKPPLTRQVPQPRDWSKACSH